MEYSSHLDSEKKRGKLHGDPQTTVEMFAQWWNRFFHSRIKERSLQRLGWLRIALALLILADRLLLTVDFKDFFLGPNCLLPYAATSQDESLMYAVTIFQWLPEAPDWLYWALQGQALVSAMLVLLGVAWPRLQLLLLYINMLQFNCHNAMIWDGEDVMFLFWTFFMLLMLFSIVVSNNLIAGFLDCSKAASSDIVGFFCFIPSIIFFEQSSEDTI